MSRNIQNKQKSNRSDKGSTQQKKMGEKYFLFFQRFPSILFSLPPFSCSSQFFSDPFSAELNFFQHLQVASNDNASVPSRNQPNSKLSHSWRQDCRHNQTELHGTKPQLQRRINWTSPRYDPWTICKVAFFQSSHPNISRRAKTASKSCQRRRRRNWSTRGGDFRCQKKWINFHTHVSLIRAGKNREVLGAILALGGLNPKTRPCWAFFRGDLLVTEGSRRNNWRECKVCLFLEECVILTLFEDHPTARTFEQLFFQKKCFSETQNKKPSHL